MTVWGATEVGIAVGSALSGALVVVSLVSLFIRSVLGLMK